MKIWKITIVALEDDAIIDTYRGIAQDARQAESLAMERAISDRNAAIDELATTHKMSSDEITEEKQGELYASEITFVCDVEFGI